MVAELLNVGWTVAFIAVFMVAGLVLSVFGMGLFYLAERVRTRLFPKTGG